MMDADFVRNVEFEINGQMMPLDKVVSNMWILFKMLERNTEEACSKAAGVDRFEERVRELQSDLNDRAEAFSVEERGVREILEEFAIWYDRNVEYRSPGQAVEHPGILVDQWMKEGYRQ